MAQWATASDFAKLWTQYDQTSERLLKKILHQNMTQRRRAASNIIKKMKKGKTLDGPVMRWVEEEGYPTEVTAQLATTTLTLSGTLQGAALTTASCNNAIRVGTILQRASDRFNLRVGSVSFAGPTFSCGVAGHGPSTLNSDDAGPVTWKILSEGWTSFRDFDSTRMLTRKFREVGHQIHAESFELSDMHRNTKYELVENELEHQVTALTDKLYLQHADVVLNQVPAYSGGAPVYGNKVEESFNCGLLHWPVIVQAEKANTNIYVNKSSTDLLKSDIDDLVLAMKRGELANFDQGNWSLLCDDTMHGQMQDWGEDIRYTDREDPVTGYNVKRIKTKIGKELEIVPDFFMPSGTIAVANLSACEWGYYAGGTLGRKPLATQGLYGRWGLSMVTWGVKVDNPRANIGMIYGCAE
jgi:hypothetical protein